MCALVDASYEINITATDRNTDGVRGLSELWEQEESNWT